MRLQLGEVLTPKWECTLWDDNIQNENELLKEGDFLLIIEDANHELGRWYQPRKIRLNHNRYRKVLTPRGKIGWVHVDNCVVIR